MFKEEETSIIHLDDILRDINHFYIVEVCCFDCNQFASFNVVYENKRYIKNLLTNKFRSFYVFINYNEKLMRVVL